MFTSRIMRSWQLTSTTCRNQAVRLRHGGTKSGAFNLAPWPFPLHGFLLSRPLPLLEAATRCTALSSAKTTLLRRSSHSAPNNGPSRTPRLLEWSWTTGFPSRFDKRSRSAQTIVSDMRCLSSSKRQSAVTSKDVCPKLLSGVELRAHLNRTTWHESKSVAQNFLIKSRTHSDLQNDAKGVIIAEGDVLTLCIRLFSELLQGHFEIPLPNPSESLLARHAASLLQENQDLFASIHGEHRSEAFNSLILPQSQVVVEAIGHALAYSAGVSAGLPKPIMDVYEAAVVRQDPAWYSEEGITRMDQRRREDAAVSSFMPHLDDFLTQLNIERYVSAPIVSDDSWKGYLNALTVHSGNAVPQGELFQAVL